MRKLLLATAAVVAISAAPRAHADYYAYGLSGFQDATLTVTFLGGGSMTFRTGAVESGNSPVTQGWWSNASGNSDSNTNYITGNLGGTLYNDFFVFNLANFRGLTATSATLGLNAATISQNLTYKLWDVTTPLSDLQDLNSGPNAAIYADLGSGVEYGGGFAINPGESSSNLSFALNATGIAAVQTHLGGEFAIGGTVNQAVPEPASLALLGTGLMGFGLLRRKRR